MVGTIEKQNSNLIPVTLAGPAEGIISKVAYCCDIDYEIVVTNGGIGTGFVGVSTCCPITYNPWCCVGTDPDTGEEIHKGVLKVDCLIAEDMQGAECACYIWKEQSNSNVSLSIPLWDTTQIGDGYFSLQESGGYPLTYNPISGFFNACNICTSFVNVSGCILQQNGSATTVVTPSETCILGNGCKYDYKFESHTNCPITIGYSETNSESYVSANAFYGKKFSADTLVTCCIQYAADPLNNYIRFGNNCVTISEALYATECLYADTICGLSNIDIIGETSAELRQFNDDTCACVCLDRGFAYLYGCMGICLNAPGVNIRTSAERFNATDTCFYTCYLEVECGIHTGYDIVGYCDGIGGDLSWYIYCDGSSCFAKASIFCLPVSTCKVAGSCWASYANSCYIPSAHEIRCYLYNRCAATAYSSGTTLFIRTQGNAGWS